MNDRELMEQVEVVGYQWLDTAHYRRTIPHYVDQSGVALWHELMTVEQHKRILADIKANRDALLLVMQVEDAIKAALDGYAKTYA